jgi:hypothetical protein
MFNKKIKLLFILCAVFFLTGCQSILLIRNVTVAQITPIIKDYAGIHGYLITYQNDQTGSYRLSLGQVYIPNTSQTVKTSQGLHQITSENINQQTMTSYEQTTWQSVNMPGHYVEASVMVRILQQGDNVSLVLNSNDILGSSLNDLQSYLKELGYTVENK